MDRDGAVEVSEDSVEEEDRLVVDGERSASVSLCSERLVEEEEEEVEVEEEEEEVDDVLLVVSEFSSGSSLKGLSPRRFCTGGSMESTKGSTEEYPQATMERAGHRRNGMLGCQ